MTKLIRDCSSLKLVKKPIVATLGKFDGMHIGHQMILEKLKERAQAINAHSVLLSFYPNPGKIINPNKRYEAVTTFRQRLKILEQEKIDSYLLLRFSLAFSKLSAKDFIQKILIDDMNIQELLIGKDASVGYKREGDAEFIKKLFEKNQRKVQIFDFAQYSQDKVSTGWLRDVLAAGDLKTFRKLTNRNYIISSYVVHGDGRGHDLGFPTANLKKNKQVMPMAGIYATRCKIDGKTLPSVTSVGIRPTFNGKEKIIEVHLIDFPDTDLYSKKIDLEFIDLLRAEIKYESVSELIRQIKLDIENAKSILLTKNS